MPDVVQRLIVEHVPDENNRCRGCTLPGTGRPNEPWPCSLRELAEQARRLQPDAVPHDPDQTRPARRPLRLPGHSDPDTPVRSTPSGRGPGSTPSIDVCPAAKKVRHLTVTRIVAGFRMARPCPPDADRQPSSYPRA